MDINPKPLDGISWAFVRFFRMTNTTGDKAVKFFKGNETVTLEAQIGVDGTDTFFNGGDVGIGTSSPNYKLHVNGTIYASGVAGVLSDLRHKTDIIDLSFDAMEIVNQLRPVSFEWKEPQDIGMEGTQLGFIAQEVEEVLPEAVLTQDNEEQTKGLKYNALIPVLTKAIQELEVQNKLLRDENNSLKKEIEQIKKVIGL